MFVSHGTECFQNSRVTQMFFRLNEDSVQAQGLARLTSESTKGQKRKDGSVLRAGLTILDAACQSLGAEASKNHRVDGTNASTGQQGRHRQRGRRHVDGHPVPFLHAVALQGVSQTTGCLQQLSVGQKPEEGGRL